MACYPVHLLPVVSVTIFFWSFLLIIIIERYGYVIVYQQFVWSATHTQTWKEINYSDHWSFFYWMKNSEYESFFLFLFFVLSRTLFNFQKKFFPFFSLQTYRKINWFTTKRKKNKKEMKISGAIHLYTHTHMHTFKWWTKSKSKLMRSIVEN